MKYIAVILSIYFLALGIVPCNDGDESGNDTELTTIIGFNGDHDHHDHGDLCSPFCQCHCCHTHSVTLDIVVFEPIQPIILQERFAYFDSVGKDIQLSLLHPPQA
ncbi:DUF6660 family protein [Flavobacteriaceae bacterium 3-367]|uniref:DUF6660 family protein n=1 Tax=Eudoraea algarum TaxID=3417568 RepID=UPI00328C6B25